MSPTRHLIRLGQGSARGRWGSSPELRFYPLLGCSSEYSCSASFSAMHSANAAISSDSQAPSSRSPDAINPTTTTTCPMATHPEPRRLDRGRTPAHTRSESGPASRSGQPPLGRARDGRARCARRARRTKAVADVPARLPPQDRNSSSPCFAFFMGRAILNSADIVRVGLTAGRLGCTPKPRELFGL